MSRRYRTIATVLAVAWAVMLPASCPCTLPSTAPTAHECCAPSSAVRAVEDGCCGGAISVLAMLTVTPSPDMALPALTGSAVGRPRGVVSLAGLRAVSVSPSPPPLILRI